MKNAFEVRELLPRTLVQRVLRKENPKNGYVALGNLFAERDWTEIHEGHVEEVLRRYHVTKMDRSAATALYTKALRAATDDLVIDDHEAEELSRLRRLLGLVDSDVAEIDEAVVHSKYQRAIDHALDDRKLTAEEKESLDRLRKALRIDERKAIAMLESSASNILKQEWSAAMADQRLSDDEMLAITAMAQNFGITDVARDIPPHLIDRYRRLWMIENGDFPAYDVPINLQKSERCHFVAPATWNERRRRTTRVRYAGPTARIKIMKGLYYRAGDLGVQRVTQEVLQEIDRGTLYFTNKRVIFDGNTKNKTLTFRSILGFTPYSDAIEVEKTSGRTRSSPFPIPSSRA